VILTVERPIIAAGPGAPDARVVRDELSWHRL